jgi:hypothetical protein
MGQPTRSPDPHGKRFEDRDLLLDSSLWKSRTSTDRHILPALRRGTVSAPIFVDVNLESLDQTVQLYRCTDICDQLRRCLLRVPRRPVMCCRSLRYAGEVTGDLAATACRVTHVTRHPVGGCVLYFDRLGGIGSHIRMSRGFLRVGSNLLNRGIQL